MRDFVAGTDLEMEIGGDFGPCLRQHARMMIASLTRYTDIPLIHVRVKLTRTSSPPASESVVAQASAELAGRRIRAQVAVPTADEGLALLSEVLRHRISCLQQSWEARLGLAPATSPPQWRHPAERLHRPPIADRSEGERAVLRYKRFEPAKRALDEAIEDLELAGYLFYVFADDESGQPLVVFRDGDRGYGTAKLEDLEPMDEAAALSKMNGSGCPYLCYADPVTGRCHVMYRRFDGNFGLIMTV